MISFAGKEVLELAIKIEQNGVTFYKSLADRTTNSQISDIFGRLAQEEQDHISTLKEWLDKLAGRETTESYSEEYGAYMKNLADESAYQCNAACQSLVSKATTELETIQVGLFFEKDFLLFLYEMRGFVAQPDTGIIDSLIKEEKQHLIQLLRLKKSLETP